MLREDILAQQLLSGLSVALVSLALNHQSFKYNMTQPNLPVAEPYPVLWEQDE